MRMMILAGLACAVTALAAAPAAAQQVGMYSGTLANGNQVQFTVDTDANTGALEITSASVGISTPCFGGPTLYEGEGFGLGTDIVNGAASVVASFPNFYAQFTIRFNANGSIARGAMLTVAPNSNYDGSTRPNRFYTCTAPNSTFTVNLQPSDAVPAFSAHVPANAHYVYDRRGRIIASETH